MIYIIQYVKYVHSMYEHYSPEVGGLNELPGSWPMDGVLVNQLVHQLLVKTGYSYCTYGEHQLLDMTGIVTYREHKLAQDRLVTYREHQLLHKTG